MILTKKNVSLNQKMVLKMMFQNILNNNLKKKRESYQKKTNTELTFLIRPIFLFFISFASFFFILFKLRRI